MEWVLRSPQIHSTFGNLGFAYEDGYHINENCNSALETILHNILVEDKYLRSYRRSLSVGQNIKKDLIPLFIHTKEDKTIELLLRILVNLTIPVECLLAVDVISKTDFGRHTVFEINNLLASTKSAFTDIRVTKVLMVFLKKNADGEQKAKLSAEQCTNISNSLLLVRNILHIPEDIGCLSPNCNGGAHMQNQILWNIFSFSIDKILIKLMTIPDATCWGVTMVQLVALLYKDQHVVQLHKLLNIWLETSLSESSDDNESNTSPPNRGSEDSSPMLTSDPTSDSSDTGGSKSNDEPNSMNNGWDVSSMNNTSENGNQPFQPMTPSDKDTEIAAKSYSPEKPIDEKMQAENEKEPPNNGAQTGVSKLEGQSLDGEKKTVVSETSDCGYGTQIEHQESISTSSNDDEVLTKPVHQKPHNAKQRINTKARVGITLQERRRKKMVRRGKSIVVNLHGLSHNTPTEEEISNILKEFTVDFLLKGYNTLVQTLHSQILTNLHMEIDTSHFFWLITYFLKFATQIELDLEHVSWVLSFDIVSYLSAEGVNLCEQFELAIKIGSDLKPTMRRLHLIVTGIREFVQAIELYLKFPRVCKEDKDSLIKLQIKMCEAEDLRSLLVLLLRHYNPKYHTKQYLQDLIVTNHILLMFLDTVMKLPDFSGSTNMRDHIKQFATPEIMYQYGLLLEDYETNGEFVNDCVFTLMHHVGGELDSLICLFQPKILKAFTSIWKSDYEICDDWSDLIEYVINTFIKKPHTLHSPTNFRLDTESFDDEKVFAKPLTSVLETKKGKDIDVILKSNADDIDAFTDMILLNMLTVFQGHDLTIKLNNFDYWTNIKIAKKNTAVPSIWYVWTEDEISSLSWNYLQCNALPDVVGEIVKIFEEDGINKTRESVINELSKQNLINKEAFDTYSKKETDVRSKMIQKSKERRDDEIGKLCEQLALDGRSKFLYWVQRVLLETCFAKMYLEKKALDCLYTTAYKKKVKLLHFELFKEKQNDLPVMSPVSYHSLIYNQSVPLVPWNGEQALMCKDLKFLQLLHKLGFHMPVDTGKVFIRIPHFWTADFLYEVAGKIAPIDTSKLNFSLKDLSDNNKANLAQQNSFMLSSDLAKDITKIATPENVYQINKQKHLATMVNFTPMPGSTYSSEECETSKLNWLKVVQKSQECKIAFNLGSSHEVDEDIVMQSGIEMRLPQPGQNLLSSPMTATSPGAVPLVLPTVMTTKQDSLDSHLPADSEFFNSACETASVASDLTRMYVSDEDEKPEVILRRTLSRNPSMEDHGSGDFDVSAKKRPRVQSIPF